MTLHASLDEERAHLVVQLGGMYIIHPLCINCILHMGPAWGVPVHYIYVPKLVILCLHTFNLRLDSLFLFAHNSVHSSSMVVQRLLLLLCLLKHALMSE